MYIYIYIYIYIISFLSVRALGNPHGEKRPQAPEGGGQK